MEKNEILKEANEALQRTLLMMNYDMKKTLSENVEVITEQTVPCSSNPMSEDDIYSLVDDTWQTLQNMQAIFVRMVSANMNGVENAKEIFNNINNLVNQTVIDDITKTCKPALSMFKEVYKERAKKGGPIFSTEPDIIKELESLSKDDYFVENVGQRGTKYITAAINTLKTGGVKAATPTDTSWSKDLMAATKNSKKQEAGNVNGVPSLKVTYPNSYVHYAKSNRWFQYTPSGTLTKKGSWKIENGKLVTVVDGSKTDGGVKSGGKVSGKTNIPAITDKNLLSTLNFEYTYPGDNTYVYDFVPNKTVSEQTSPGGTWYAKNLKTGKVFNITQNFPKTAEKLNLQYPSAANPVDKSPKNLNTTSSEKTSSPDVSDIQGKKLEVKPVGSKIDPTQKINLSTTKTTTMKPTTQDMSNLDIFGSSGTAKESVKKSLKRNLTEVKEKKENLMVETNIVEKRFTFIVEGNSFDTPEKQDYLVESVISEIGYLKAQGYTPKAINEGLFSMLGSLLGGSAQAVPAVFGEYIAGWLTKQLGIPQDSYMNGVIVSLVGNLNISDYDRFFSDCRFASNKIADSLIEGYVVQLQNQKGANTGASGFIVSAMRNAVVDYFTEDKNSLIQILEDKIGEFLCPKLSKLSSVIGDKTDDMKAKMTA